MQLFFAQQAAGREGNFMQTLIMIGIAIVFTAISSSYALSAEATAHWTE